MKAAGWRIKMIGSACVLTDRVLFFAEGAEVWLCGLRG